MNNHENKTLETLTARFEEIKTHLDETNAKSIDFLKALLDAIAEREGIIGELNKQVRQIGEAVNNYQQQLEEAQTAIAERDGKIGELHEQVHQLGSEVGTYQQRLAEAQTAIDERDGKIGELHEQVHQLGSEVGTYQQRLTEAQTAIDERDGKIGELHEQVHQLGSEVGTYQQRLAEAQTAIDERDGKIGELHEQVQRLDEAVSDYQYQLAEAQTAIDERDGKIGELHEQVQRLDEAVSNYQYQLAEAQTTIDEQDGKIGGLNEQITKKETERQEELRRTQEEKANAAESARKTLRQYVEKLGEKRLLTMLDDLTKAPFPESNGPTPLTIKAELHKWLKEITRTHFKADLERISVDEEVIVHRDAANNLYVFEPANPFSDEFPQARCRVLSCGWRAGDIIIERARLEVLEKLTLDAIDLTDEVDFVGTSDPSDDTEIPPNEEQLIAWETALFDSKSIWGEGLESLFLERLEIVLRALFSDTSADEASKQSSKTWSAKKLGQAMKKWKNNGIREKVLSSVADDADLCSFLELRWDRLSEEGQGH